MSTVIVMKARPLKMRFISRRSGNAYRMRDLRSYELVDRAETSQGFHLIIQLKPRRVSRLAGISDGWKIRRRTFKFRLRFSNTTQMAQVLSALVTRQCAQKQVPYTSDLKATVNLIYTWESQGSEPT